MNEQRSLSPGRRRGDRWRAVFGDYRNWAVVPAALAFAALLVFATQQKTIVRERAEAAVAAEQRAKAREAELRIAIEITQRRLEELQSMGGDNREEIGRLRAQVEALQEQLRQAGRAPVVTTSPTTTARPTSTTTSSTTSTSTTTTTTRCTRANVLGRCVLP